LQIKRAVELITISVMPDRLNDNVYDKFGGLGPIMAEKVRAESGSEREFCPLSPGGLCRKTPVKRRGAGGV
jgi:hypothetical protein